MDRLFEDGERFRIGGIEAEVMFTPGHTAASIAYRIGDAAFVHDTLFMPDSGTARADFRRRRARPVAFDPPAARAAARDAHLRRARLHAGRAPWWESTVAEQRARNIHVRDGITEEEFVRMREARDTDLPLPALMLDACAAAGGPIRKRTARPA